MDPEEKTPPPPIGKASDIPIPALGTPEPTADIPPLTGELSEAPRRKRGRRMAGTEEPAPPPSAEPVATSPEATEQLSAALANAFTVVAGIISAMRGEHWQLKPEDAKALGDSGAVCLAPYMASSAKYVPWALFGLNVAGVVMPRLQEDARRAKEVERANPPNIAVIP